MIQKVFLAVYKPITAFFLFLFSKLNKITYFYSFNYILLP